MLAKRHRLNQKILRLFSAVSACTNDCKLVRNALRLAALEKTFVYAVGNNNAVRFVGCPFENVFDKFGGIMHVVAITINVLIEIFINEFVDKTCVHQKYVRGNIFGLTMKTCGDGQIVNIGYFNSLAGKSERYKQMHYVRAFYRLGKHFIVGFCERNSVFRQNFITKLT